ncbi:hypothetical protein RRG08_060419 [Elysia crispata]|uniref:SCAN domain-containing protein 3 n=1 Tax=Elysia crispata TaxID=231223 RepID=A0AAE1AMF6_9GAST|nr:hypothetical protein RRG08_060419 [Elysia crispata]
MFHIALLLLLAGPERLFRPVVATSLTSEENMEAGSITSEESIRVPRLKRAVTDKPEYVPQKVTKKDRDTIRTVLEVTATNFFDHDVYYRANGTDVIEIQKSTLLLRLLWILALVKLISLTNKGWQPNSKQNKKCRQYSVEYLKYGVVSAPQNQQQPMCLLCEKVFSNEAMKPSRLLEHLTKIHSDKVDKKIAYFQSLREKFQKRKTIGNMFASTSQQSTDGLRASYNISLLIARSGKPHAIGKELIQPAVREVLHTVVHKSPDQIMKAIPLSDNSVQRRVDEMAENIEETLCNILAATEFSLQIDESTLPGNESLLLAYVCFVKDEKLVQELLFARQLKTDTKGESVFNVVENFFKEKNIPLSNILACATDGVPSMIGHHRGFISFLKKAVPGVLTVHCVIHRQHLVAKNLSGRLYKSMNTVYSSK